MDDIKYITSEEKEFVKSLLKSVASNQKGYCGRIISFIIPKTKLDLYVYNALPGGCICSIPLTSYCYSCSFDEINTSQGRVIDFHTADEDISIETFEDVNFISSYKAQIDNKLLSN